MKEKQFDELLEGIKQAGEYIRAKRKAKKSDRSLLPKRSKLNCVATDKCQINLEEEMR